MSRLKVTELDKIGNKAKMLISKSTGINDWTTLGINPEFGKIRIILKYLKKFESSDNKIKKKNVLVYHPKEKKDVSIDVEIFLSFDILPIVNVYPLDDYSLKFVFTNEDVEHNINESKMKENIKIKNSDASTEGIDLHDTDFVNEVYKILEDDIKGEFYNIFGRLNSFSINDDASKY